MDTRLRDALRTIARAGIACARRAPSLADDADLAEDVQVALEHDSAVVLERRLAEAEHRVPLVAAEGALVGGHGLFARYAVSVGAVGSPGYHPEQRARGVSSRPPALRVTMSKPVPTPPSRVIRPARRSGLPDFRELWRSRDLAMILAWRDVKVRYKQSLIGIAWAVLQPFLTMVVFTLIFGKFAQLPSQGLPYPVFAMLNLVPWTFLAAVFTLTAGLRPERTGCSSRRCTSRS